MGALKPACKGSGGATTSENDGISNFNEMKTLIAVHPRFPIPWQSWSG